MKFFIILLCFICIMPSISYAQAIETSQTIIEEPQLRKQKRTQTIVEDTEEIENEETQFIWDYLKDLGYSDIVCAGILGNIMVEVGGNTLKLETMIETTEYYGICQWSKKYYSDVIGLDLEKQCDFLRDTIKYELDTFGCGYDSFLKQTACRDAALKFAEGYERCNKSTYTLRQNCAEVAYRYFVLGELE